MVFKSYKNVYLENTYIMSNIMQKEKKDWEQNKHNYQKHPSKSVDLGSLCDILKWRSYIHRTFPMKLHAKEKLAFIMLFMYPDSVLAKSHGQFHPISQTTLLDWFYYHLWPRSWQTGLDWRSDLAISHKSLVRWKTKTRPAPATEG